MSETITNYITFALGSLDSMGVPKETVDQLLYIEQEAARDQAAEDALNLTDEEKEESTEQTRLDAENAMTEGAKQNRANDALDYLFGNERTAFDKEPW